MTFLFPYLLWLLPLSLLPLIFHLFNRNKYIKINFSSLKFFKIIEEETLKRISIYNILLLIIRTLIILLIILIVSRPYLKGSYNSNLDLNNQSLTVLLIDNSYSNTFYNNNKINKVLTNIKEIYSPNTNIHIYISNNQYPLFTGKIQELNLNKLKIPNTINTSSLRNSINDINFNKYTDYINKTFIIIGDQQENFFDANPLNDFIDNSWNTIVYKTINNNNNISITNIDINKEMIIPNELVNFRVTLQNNGIYDFNDRIIELYINDIKVGFEQFNLKAQNNINIDIKSSFSDVGNHNCYLKIEDDDLYLDNHYYFNINIPEKRNIIILSNDKDNYFFLKEAISSFNEKYNNFTLTIYNYNEFLKSDISNLNSLFIFGYENYNDPVISKTNNKNISIILFPTLDVNHNTKNSKLYEIFDDDNLKDLNLINNSDGEYVSLNLNNIENNNFKNIYNINPKNRNLKIFNYNYLKSNKNTILQYSNNKAFLNYYKKNNNNVYLFSTSLSLKDTNLPIKGTFLPIIYNLININNKKIFYYADDNTNILSNNFLNQRITITNPINEKYTYNNSYSKINAFNTVGFYKLFYNDINEEDFLSININEEEFSSTLSKNQIINSLNNNNYFDQPQDLKLYLNNLLYGYEIWRYLLYVLVILVFIEMYLSNYYLYGRK